LPWKRRSEKEKKRRGKIQREKSEKSPNPPTHSAYPAHFNVHTPSHRLSLRKRRGGRPL